MGGASKGRVAKKHRIPKSSSRNSPVVPRVPATVPDTTPMRRGLHRFTRPYAVPADSLNRAAIEEMFNVFREPNGLFTSAFLPIFSFNPSAIFHTWLTSMSLSGPTIVHRKQNWA